VRLPVVHHLQPVLDRAEQPVGVLQRSPLAPHDPTGFGKRGKGGKRCRRAQHRLAATMDELVHLRVELDLADAAAAALQVKAGAECLAFGIMVADSARHRLKLADGAEIERTAPHERVDGVQEIAAERLVAGGHAGADKSGALPGQSA
jgi:hypothetical protein